MIHRGCAPSASRQASGALLRDCVEVPVIGALKQEVQRRGDAYLVRVIGRAGLNEQDARGRVLREPRGKDTSGATRTDDDIVVHGNLTTTVSSSTRYPTRA